MVDAVWYVVDEGRNLGPLSTSEVDELIQSGSLHASSLVCPEGGQDWSTLGQTEPFAGAFSAGSLQAVAGCAQPIESDWPVAGISAGDNVAWYVAGAAGSPSGPFTTDEVMAGITIFAIPGHASVCADGASQWRPLKSIPAFRLALQQANGTPAPATSHEMPNLSDDDDWPDQTRTVIASLAAGMRSAQDDWYVAIGGAEPIGPLSADSLAVGIGSGEVSPESLVLRPGETAWTPLVSIPAFHAAVRAALPPPLFRSNPEQPSRAAPRRAPAQPILTEATESSAEPIVSSPSSAATAQQHESRKIEAMAWIGARKGLLGAGAAIGLVVIASALLAARAWGTKETAEGVLSRSCAMGRGEKCLVLALFAKHGAEGVEASAWRGTRLYEQAVSWFEKGCLQGDSQACVQLENAAEDKPDLLDDARASQAKAAAVKGYQTACKLGDVTGCLMAQMLADIHSGGRDSVQWDNALVRARTGCDKGDGRACLSGVALATLADAPDQKPLFQAKAEKAFRLGCDGGDLRACSEACRLAPDPSTVLQECSKACEAQLAAGCSELADYYRAQGGDKVRTSADLDRRACWYGSADGCRSYAEGLMKGGKDADRTAAYRLLAVACDARDEEACKLR